MSVTHLRFPTVSPPSLLSDDTCSSGAVVSMHADATAAVIVAAVVQLAGFEVLAPGILATFLLDPEPEISMK